MNDVMYDEIVQALLNDLGRLRSKAKGLLAQEKVKRHPNADAIHTLEHRVDSLDNALIILEGLV